MFVILFTSLFVLLLGIGVFTMVKEEITSHTLQKIMKTYFTRAKRNKDRG